MPLMTELTTFTRRRPRSLYLQYLRRNDRHDRSECARCRWPTGARRPSAVRLHHSRRRYVRLGRCGASLVPQHQPQRAHPRAGRRGPSYCRSMCRICRRSASTLAAHGKDHQPQSEVWGLAWNTSDPIGFSPAWPTVSADAPYFGEAGRRHCWVRKRRRRPGRRQCSMICGRANSRTDAKAISVSRAIRSGSRSRTISFFGDLQRAMRRQLLDGNLHDNRRDRSRDIAGPSCGRVQRYARDIGRFGQTPRDLRSAADQSGPACSAGTAVSQPRKTRGATGSARAIGPRRFLPVQQIQHSATNHQGQRGRRPANPVSDDVRKRLMYVPAVVMSLS